MRHHLPLFALGMGLLSGLGRAQPDPATRPNILVILADDLGYADVGYQGCKDVPTPNIDSIASNGVRFTAGYVTAPLCSPSRAGLLSGRSGTRFGFEFNVGGSDHGGKNAAGIPVTERIFPEYFKAAGYQTGIFGKWHVGFRPQLAPGGRSFDEWECFFGACRSYFPGGDDEVTHNGKKVKSYDYTTFLFARDAAAFIEKHRDQPWFVYLPFNAVHGPLQSPEELQKRFPGLTGKRRIFAGMLTAMDEGVGTVLRKLRELRLEENTLVFFTSDNGGPTSDNTSRNDPLSGFKGQLLEGGIREPFCIQWKGRLPAGKGFDQPVTTTDILTTALAAAGLPADAKLEGANLLPYLIDGKSGAPHEILGWRFGSQRAIRSGDWKLLDMGKGWRLFNLAKDIAERNDLSAAEPDKRKELEDAYAKWNAANIPAKWRMHGVPTKAGRQKAPAETDAGTDRD
jgi:arylsulfatase A-like enzyme